MAREPDKMKIRKTALPVTLALLLMGAGRITGESRPRIELLQVGSFHGTEVAAKSGEEWFGLIPTAGGFELRRLRIRVDAESDPLKDQGSARTGRRVSVEGGTPLVLVRGVRGLKAGPVPTMIPNSRFFYPGEHGSWRLAKDKWCALTAYGNVDRPPDSQPGATRIYAYRLVLTISPWRDENQQDIVNLHGLSDDSPPHVVWAGDLDGDSRLDLLAEIGNHENVSDMALFLSSAAEGRELVRLVARFRTVGC